MTWAHVGVVSLGALGLVVGGLGWLPPRAEELANAPPNRSARVALTNRTALADSLGALAQHDLFRADRRPAPVAFDPNRPEGQDQAEAPSAPTKPRLFVSGIAGGRAPMALLEGVPGSEQPVLVRVGDTLSGLTIRGITASQVKISGFDTTWALHVRDPW